MVVHMVRIFIEPPKGEAENAVNNWVKNHTEWQDDPVDHELIETNAALDGEGTTYIRGDYRFIQGETATDLLDALESRLSNLQGGVWYRLGYHACYHGGSGETGKPCSWDEVREQGTIPADIPKISVD